MVKTFGDHIENAPPLSDTFRRFTRGQKGKRVARESDEGRITVASGSSSAVMEECLVQVALAESQRSLQSDPGPCPKAGEYPRFPVEVQEIEVFFKTIKNLGVLRARQ